MPTTATKIDDGLIWWATSYSWNDNLLVLFFAHPTGDRSVVLAKRRVGIERYVEKKD